MRTASTTDARDGACSARTALRRALLLAVLGCAAAHADAQTSPSAAPRRTVQFATYFGGPYMDGAGPVVLDAAGNAFIAGTWAELPLIMKLDPNGAILYRTTIDADLGLSGLAVDGDGSAYVVGTTTSTVLPTTPGAFQPVCQVAPSGTCQSAYVMKIDPTGSSVAYLTYLGGGFNEQWSTAPFDEGIGIAVDRAGRAWVTGSTGSSSFPTTGDAFQPVMPGARDAFLSLLSADGSTLEYSTYIGGMGLDSGYAVAVDPAGSVYVAGETNQPSSILRDDFPTVNAFQAEPGGLRDGFVAKLAPSGDGRWRVVYSTYVGGSDTDAVLALAADGLGNAYVTGQTKSPDFPVTSPVQGWNDWTTTTGDAFVTKLDSEGGVVFSTHLGGHSFDYGTGIAADAAGNALVVGTTTSRDFLVTSTALQDASGWNDDLFVAKIGAKGSTLLYSTYLGGPTNDEGGAIAVDVSGNVLVTGSVTSDGLPVVDAFQPTRGGYFDGYVAKLDLEAPVVPLHVTRDGAGLGTVTSVPRGIACGDDCTNNYDVGATVELTAVANGIALFVGWSGACAGTGPCAVVMDAPTSVTATFMPAAILDVTVTPTAGGSVTTSPASPNWTCGSAGCSGAFVAGTTVTLMAVPAVEGTPVTWTGDWDCRDGIVSVVGYVTSCTATFGVVHDGPRRLVVARAGAGGGTVTSEPPGIHCGLSCSATFSSGSTVTLRATASPGSAFEGWSGGPCGSDATCVLAMGDDATITATFSRVTPGAPDPRLGSNESGGGGCSCRSDAGLSSSAVGWAVTLALLAVRRGGRRTARWVPSGKTGAT